MAKAKQKMPDLSNATPTFLADELGGVREQIKKFKKLEGYYKEAMLARLEQGQTTVEGEKYLQTIVEVEQMRFDTAGAKEKYGEDWYNDHCKQIEFIQVKTTKR